MNELTAQGQIAAMKALKQGAVAWLLKMNGRSVRDRADIPRLESGAYDAQAVVAWVKSGRGGDDAPELSEDELEVLRRVRDALWPDDDRCGLSILEAINGLIARHGEGVLALLWGEIETEWTEFFADADRSDMTRAEWRRERQKNEDSEFASYLRHCARARLRTAKQCERCGRVRHGRRWVKPRGDVGPVENEPCPECDGR